MTREVYILAGQSNMVGADTTSPKPIYANAPSIFRMQQPWDSTYGIPVSQTPMVADWGPASDPLHSGGAGVGPGMAFADRLLSLRNDPQLEIGLVPCGWQGSDICNAWGPAYRTWRAFSQCMARGHAAKAWGPIKGLIWYQGETDAQANPGGQYPYYWVQNMIKTIQALRIEWGILDLPVIITRLGPNPNSPTYIGWQAMQEYVDCMKGISPILGVVSASDLTVCPGMEGIHLDAPAQVTLGHRYADEMFRMQNI